MASKALMSKYQVTCCSDSRYVLDQAGYITLNLRKILYQISKKYRLHNVSSRYYIPKLLAVPGSICFLFFKMLLDKVIIITGVRPEDERARCR